MNTTKNKQSAKSVTSIDGILAAPNAKRTPRAGINQQLRRPVELPGEKQKFVSKRPQFGTTPKPALSKPPKVSKKRSFLSIAQYPFFALIALGAAYSTAIGQWFVLAYSIYVLIFQRDSRKTFIIALILLLAIPFFQIINQPGVSENVAVYTYEFLVIGTILAVIELIVDSKQTKKETITQSGS